MKHQTIFSSKNIKRTLKKFLSEKVKNKDEKLELITNWQQNINSGKILKQKEEELQSLFLHTFFGEILEYDYKNPKEWNLIEEAKTSFDLSKADGALGFFTIDKNKNITSDIRVVIELKNARTPLDKPQNRKNFKGSAVEQAFMYANKVGKSCKWVIVSNFLEIRLYPANDINKYERFDISMLNIDDEFNRFYFLLSKGQLFLRKQMSVIEYALDNRIEEEKKITAEFYAHYKALRELFVKHLITHNKTIPVLKIINLAQTIIDRIVFISVIKDYNLIAFNVLTEIEDIAKRSWEYDNMELWRQLKKLFKVLDIGLPPRLHKFNGGLFKQNSAIDNLIIKDYFLTKLLKLSNYDFESDLNINILGHIFEHSISDIEKLKKEVTSNNIEEADTIDNLIKQKVSEEINQRKKYGIFYTPEYITRYIIDNTIGKWLNDKKEKIGINNIQELANTPKQKKEQLELWDKYKTILNSITILDPACGSGAFLTQAFDYLVKEWEIIIDITQKLNDFIPKSQQKGALNFETNQLPDDLQIWKIKKRIIKNNIFGVDLNPESIEITKLGLWLKTATKKDNLANLNDNIKCGNSLISNIKIAKDNAFDWQNEFKQIFSKGGFDILIGNPPYVSHDMIENKNELSKKYKIFEPFADLYCYFFEKSINLQNKTGYLGFITSNSFLKANYGKKLRNFIFNKQDILQIINLKDTQIFNSAIVNPVIVISKYKTYNNDTKSLIVNSNFSNRDPFIDFIKKNSFFYNSKNFTNKAWSLKLPQELSVISKIKSNHKTLQNYETKIRLGIATGNNKAFIIDKETRNNLIKEDIKNLDIIKPILRGRDIHQYYYDFQDFYIILSRNEINIAKDYPVLYKYFDKFGNKFKNRGSKGNHWTNLRACSFFNDFEKEMIIWIELSDKGRFAICSDDIYLLNSAYFLIPPKEFNIKYLLAILNSKVIRFYLQSIANTSGMGTTRWINTYVKEFPIPFLSKKEQKSIAQNISKLIKLKNKNNKTKQTFINLIMSDLKINQPSKQLKNWYNLEWTEFNNELDKNKAEWNITKKKEWQTFFIKEKETIIPLINKISKIDENINKIVYKLYNLSKEEINIIEQNIGY